MPWLIICWNSSPNITAVVNFQLTGGCPWYIVVMKWKLDEATRRRHKKELRELRLTWLPVVRRDFFEEQRCFYGYFFGWVALHVRWAIELWRSGGERRKRDSSRSKSA